MTFDAVRAYSLMYLIRATEEEIVARYMRDLKMRTPTHLSIGQEAASVGVMMALPESAHVFCHHRSHAAYLAKGGNLDAMIAELHGKATGCTGGRGGSMHLTDRSVGFMASHPIVGDCISLAVGSALAAKLDGSDRVTAVFFGDGAIESGQFWEALNFTALHKLPLLFVCENNGYASQTPISQRQPPSAIRYRVHRILGWADTADGNNVQEVYQRTTELLRTLPAFLEIKTYRYKEHCGPLDDWELGYRSKEEVEAAKRNDPLGPLAEFLTPSVASGIQEAIKRRVQDAFQKAEAAPWPEVR